MSLKESTVVSDTPGKVTIRTVLCTTKDADCKPSSNLFAQADPPGDITQVQSGQLLVGFLVPLDAAAPASFEGRADGTTDRVTFTRSDSYGTELRELFAPPAGRQWIGYISNFGTYGPTSKSHRLELTPEFTLGSPAAGGVFAWRTVAGFRKTVEASAGDPVSCAATATTTCRAVPSASRLTDDVRERISDFGLFGGATTTVYPGTTAAVPFKLRYAGGDKAERESFLLGATTRLGGTNARAVPGRVSANPDTTSDVTAAVPVPLNAAPGRYAVAVRGTIGTPPVVREATGAIVVEALPRTDKPVQPAAGYLDYSWRRSPRRGTGTLFTRLLVTGVPSSGTVTVRCQGRGCPRASKTFRRRRSVGLMKQFRGRVLRPNAALTVRVAGPNRITKEIKLTTHGSTGPTDRVLCRPPGAKKARGCDGAREK